MFQLFHAWWVSEGLILWAVQMAWASHIEVKVMLLQTVSRWLSFGVKPPSGAQDQIVIIVRRPLWWRDWDVLYNCCWSSPAQSLSSPMPARLITIFYCLRFETFPTRWARFPNLYPSGRGWPSYTTRHWLPFSSPPTKKIGNPSIIVINLYIPALKSSSNYTETSLQISENITPFAVCRIYTGVIARDT
jgi:hypothetical protein